MCAKLEEIMGMCFIGNRIADRVQSVIRIDFVMPNTADIVHLHFAHAMPLVADEVSDYAFDRNYAINYPATPKDYSHYTGLKEAFSKLLMFMRDLERITSEGIDLAIAEDDKTTKVFLDKFLRKLVPYTAMFLDLCDYVDMNGDTPKDHMDMDARVNKFLHIKRQH